MRERWNVLFVTVDQWRADCLSVLDHPVVRTPHFDRLALSGTLFQRHFAQATPCGPSRASLYTGMYLMNHRVATNGTPLDARFTNVALAARRGGYDPVLFGYTDQSIDPRAVADPLDPRLFTYEGVLPGFRAVCDEVEGRWGPWCDHLVECGYDLAPDGDWRAFVEQPRPDYPGVDEWGEHRAPTKYAAEHSVTAFLTDRVIEYLESVADDAAPWFAHVSYLRPHPPFFAPAPYNTMYDPMSVPLPLRHETEADEAQTHPLIASLVGIPWLSGPRDERQIRQLRATYYGMQTEVDAHFGRLLDWLDASGQAERTIVVLTSDHGEQLGDHYLMEKLGFFDESYRVPLIVRDPRAEFDASRATMVDHFTEHVDVMPTILSLLDLDVPLQCDGRSLVPFLEGTPPAGWRDEVRFEWDLRDPANRAIEDLLGLSMEELSLAVVRDAHGKYVHFAGRPTMPAVFFDLDADPGELHNRAADPAYAATVLEYAQRLISWRLQHADRTLASTKLTALGPFTHAAPRR